ncbi:hypothetical protein [Iodidimonas sp. MBR-22]|nr:hypothetical protein [Iodidimonas sp. MBR-22]
MNHTPFLAQNWRFCILVPLIFTLILLALLAGGLMVKPAQAQQDGRIDEMPLDQRPGKSVPRGPRALSNDPMMDDPLEPLLMPDYQSVTDAETRAQAKRYHDCMRQALKAPDQARIEAMAWLSDGASIPALHCLASALVNLGDYDAAAQNFTSLADQMRTGRGVTYNIMAADDPYSLLAGIYGQLGNALLLGDHPARAYTAFSQALAEAPEQSTRLIYLLLLDRARSLGLLEDYEAAITDLEKAQDIAGWQADIALYLASAHRALGELEPALDAALQAVEMDPENPTARLERGNIQMLMGKESLARSDWNAIIERWPSSPAAAAARANLAALGEPEALSPYDPAVDEVVGAPPNN